MTASELPNISVALCTYNGAGFLREQLDSIASQAESPYEIVVCDDASTDDTVAIVEEFARSTDIALSLHRSEQNVGVAKNFERAISLCKGEWIALADQDDVWEPQKQEHLAAAIRREPSLAYAFSDATLVDEGGRALGGKTLLARRFALSSIDEKFRARRELDLMLKRDFIYGTTLMIRADVRDLLLPIALGWSHDTWIVNVLAAFGLRGVPVLEPLVLYRQHGVQASGGISDPKSTPYAERCAAYQALKSHLAERSQALGQALKPGVIDRIDEKLKYLEAMRDMQTIPLHRRFATAAGEVMSGRWWKYTPRTITVDKRFDLGRLPGFRS